MKQLLLLLTLYLSATLLYAHKSYVVFGPPGGGKGTFAAYCVEAWGHAHISLGDIVRKNTKMEESSVRYFFSQWKIASSDTASWNLIKPELLNALKENRPFVIDGFPHTRTSLGYLEQFFTNHGVDADVVFVLIQADDATCYKRIIHRKSCTACGKTYSDIVHPTLTRCTQCKNQLVRRLEDIPWIVQLRLSQFHKDIEPMIAFAARKHKVHKVNTKCSAEKLADQYEKLFEKIQNTTRTTEMGTHYQGSISTEELEEIRLIEE